MHSLLSRAPRPISRDLRAGEVATPAPDGFHESVYFIGTIRTPWRDRAACPKRGDMVEGPLCQVEVDEHWRDALGDIQRHERLQLLYWMHLARRDLVRQSPKDDGRTLGTFALRSPMRPNPIAVSMVALIRVEGATLTVRGLDCVDGTPLIDVKPEHCPHAP